MSKRNDHFFQFSANAIAAAAIGEAEYHEQRVAYWQHAADEAYVIVERTIGARIQKQEITGGWRYDVIVDYGDPAASRRLNEATQKIASHLEAATRYRSDALVYETQGARSYELDSADVAYFRLNVQPRDE